MQHGCRRLPAAAAAVDWHSSICGSLEPCKLLVMLARPDGSMLFIIGVPRVTAACCLLAIISCKVVQLLVCTACCCCTAALGHCMSGLQVLIDLLAILECISGCNVHHRLPTRPASQPGLLIATVTRSYSQSDGRSTCPLP